MLELIVFTIVPIGAFENAGTNIPLMVPAVGPVAELVTVFPMIEKFKDKVIEIDGEPTVDEVYKNVKQAFENKGLTK